MGRKRLINESMSQREKFEMCLSEAYDLYVGDFDFIPELDNLQNDTVGDVLFKVLHEWDLADEGETVVPKSHLRKAENFFVRWRDHIEPELENEKEMYKDF